MQKHIVSDLVTTRYVVIGTTDAVFNVIKTSDIY